MTNLVNYELNESVATIALDDGKVNVLGPAMQTAINEALDRAEKDDAKAVVLTGNQRVFSGGVDLSVFQSGDPPAARAVLGGGGGVFFCGPACPPPAAIAAPGAAGALGCFFFRRGRPR